MELKGLAKQGRVVAIAMASCGMALGMTAPVAAAQEGETWEMPAVKEELLQDAVDSIISAAGEENVKLAPYDSELNQVIYNYTNWIVCAQSPAAEKEVTINPAKPQAVYLALKRPAAGC
ncbi:hypothetical protein PDG61_27520 [Mycolicibacterium sp. BiH015]|uniref:hypothetical protein n=1 Tax=Mycolicibacterium sp. BiH015 TaxID=3018808 RepID=UPI0022E2F41E|nr:hypothetical protein [Mycolicibacterium sp. BiH015]MDA2894689.1 hypothetical protein [Mycolicibacterium sp. BiH015]